MKKHNFEFSSRELRSRNERRDSIKSHNELHKKTINARQQSFTVLDIKIEHRGKTSMMLRGDLRPKHSKQRADFGPLITFRRVFFERFRNLLENNRFHRKTEINNNKSQSFEVQ